MQNGVCSGLIFKYLDSYAVPHAAGGDSHGRQRFALPRHVSARYNANRTFHLWAKWKILHRIKNHSRKGRFLKIEASYMFLRG